MYKHVIFIAAHRNQNILTDKDQQGNLMLEKLTPNLQPHHATKEGDSFEIQNSLQYISKVTYINCVPTQELRLKKHQAGI